MFRRWGRWGCQRAVQLCWRDPSLFLDLAEVVDDDADAEVEDEEGALVERFDIEPFPDFSAK